MNILKKLYYAQIVKELDGCERVLDLGCGKSSILSKLGKKFYSVGVDAFAPDLEESKRLGLHNEYVLSDILKVDFPENYFDAIISFQVLEHITKEEGHTLIKKMERWAKKKIVITTPNSFVPQEMTHDGNDLQEHKSGWTPDDFAAIGFRVHGFAGIKFFCNSPYAILRALYYASYPFMWFMPNLAFQLLATKEVKKS